MKSTNCQSIQLYNVMYYVRHVIFATANSTWLQKELKEDPIVLKLPKQLTESAADQAMVNSYLSKEMVTKRSAMPPTQQLALG